jgi:hypothetical protein
VLRAPHDLSGWSATTKLEKLAVTARTPFQEAMERVDQFRRRRHAISRSLCETDDLRIDPHAPGENAGIDLADG